MARNYLCVPFEYFQRDAAELTDAEFGRLVRGMYQYFTTGEAISPEGNERFFVKGAMADQDSFRRKYDEITEKRRIAGQAGANKRWQAVASDSKCHQVIASDGKHIAKNSGLVLDIDIDNSDIESNKLDNNVVPNSNVVPKEKERKKEKEKNSEFDRFWAVYPNKKGKGAARAAFAKAQAKGVPVDTMIQAVEAQKQSRQWKEAGGQYIPHPATWLNQERWEDAVEIEIEDDYSWNPFLQIMKEEHKKNEQGADGGGVVYSEGGVSVILSGDG